MSAIFVDTQASLSAFLDGLPDCNGRPPSLYIDLEGNDLSRHGTLSIVTVLVQPEKKIYLIDTTTLGMGAFTTKSSKGVTLKEILESNDIIKVFFDVRNDSDALFAHHGIRLNNVEDLQLFEFASRNFEKRVVHGLKKCIDNDLNLTYTEKQAWLKIKEQGQRFFASGNFAVFDERPMSEVMIEYCVQDVVYMPKLREVYSNKLCDAWYFKIMDETKARIRLSQTPTFNGKGRHMAMGPTGWRMWQPPRQERHQRTLFQSNPIRQEDKQTTPESKPEAELGPIAQALVEATIQHSGGRNIDSDEDHFEDGHFAMGYSSDGGNSGPRDLTACDKECGYCGHCPY